MKKKHIEIYPFSVTLILVQNITTILHCVRVEIYPFSVTLILVQNITTILHCVRVHSSSDAIEVVISVQNVIHRPSEPKKVMITVQMGHIVQSEKNM